MRYRTNMQMEKLKWLQVIFFTLTIVGTICLCMDMFKQFWMTCVLVIGIGLLGYVIVDATIDSIESEVDRLLRENKKKEKMKHDAGKDKEVLNEGR